MPQHRKQSPNTASQGPIKSKPRPENRTGGPVSEWEGLRFDASYDALVCARYGTFATYLGNGQEIKSRLGEKISTCARVRYLALV